MAKANPKAWFTSPIAKISYKSVDKFSMSWKAIRPYFDTWKEAHDYMVEKAKTSIARYERDAASARRHLAKLQSMSDPTSNTDKEQPA